MKVAKSKALCSGCRDDFYNGNNSLGVQECWCFKTAKVVTRWKAGWWTPQESRSAFVRVETLSCHNAPGKYALYERLPQHLGGGAA